MRLLALGLLAMLAMGCQTNLYEIQMRPTPEGFKRTLTCHRDGQQYPETVPYGGFPQVKLDRAAEAYGAPKPSADSTEHVFERVFTQATPDDVGGWGHLHRYRSPLGTTYEYVECFRPDDVRGAGQRRAAAAARLARLLETWLAAELAGRDGLPSLRCFLRGDFRRDVEELSRLWATAWPDALSSRGKDQAGPAELLLHFYTDLIGLGYAEPGDVAAAVADPPVGTLPYVRRLVARFVPLGDGREPAFLASPEAFGASFDRFLKTTRMVADALRAWRRAHPNAGALRAPQAGVVFARTVTGELLPLAGIDVGDWVDVRLALSVAPLRTNGVYDEALRAITWKRPLWRNAARAVRINAVWVEPDKSVQTKHLGRVLVQGEQLLDFNVAYRALREEERAVWDAFLVGLEPGPGLEDRVRAFEFPPGPDVPNSERDRRISPRNALVGALMLGGRSPGR